MSTKIFYCFLLSVSLLFFSCGGRKNGGLGNDYYRMSLLELEQGDRGYKKALYYIDKAIDQDASGVYVAHRGTILFLLGKTRESLRCFECALSSRLSPRERSEVLNNCACLFASIGMKSDALSIFSSLESDESYLTPEVALVNQAKLYYEDGSYEQACSKLCNAIDRAPLYVDAHYYLGLVYYAMGRYEDALKSSKSVMDLVDSHDGAAELYERCKLKIY